MDNRICTTEPLGIGDAVIDILPVSYPEIDELVFLELATQVVIDTP